MKTTAKIGGILELEIQRANGDVEYIGKIHNVVGRAAELNDRVPYLYASANTAGVVNFFSRDARGSSDLDGTYSQSGTTVTRVTGTTSLSDLTNGDLIEFSTGERAYKTASIGATSCTVSRSQTVATTTAKRHKTQTAGFGINASTGAIGSSASATSFSNESVYSNGVVTNTMLAPRAFPSAVAPYTLRCISAGIFLASQTVAYSSYYDLPVDVPILAGDVIIVKTWVYTITFDDYLPREFASSIISGLSGAGRYQRMTLIQDHQNKLPTNPRIHLLTDANKITVPNMPGFTTTYINPASLTVIETISANALATAASYTNNNTQTLQIIASPNVGGTVKQILWGESNQIWGVIEFDTPVVIAADTALSIITSLQMEIELP